MGTSGALLGRGSVIPLWWGKASRAEFNSGPQRPPSIGRRVSRTDTPAGPRDKQAQAVGTMLTQEPWVTNALSP